MQISDEKILIKLGELQPNPSQPPERTLFDAAEIESLALSILNEGLHYPIIVRKNFDKDYFEVADGWQRKVAFEWLVRNGHPEYGSIPATIRGFTDDEMVDIILTTSEKQKPLSPIGRAWLYRKYLVEHPGLTQANYADRRGVSQAEIANTMRLLDLPEKVQRMVISHEISESHGRALLALKEGDLMIEYALDAINNSWSVATLESVIRTYIAKHKPKLVESAPKYVLTEIESQEITEVKVTEKAPEMKSVSISGGIPEGMEIPESEITTTKYIESEKTPPAEKPDMTVDNGKTAAEAKPKSEKKDKATDIKPAISAPAPAAAPKPNWGRKLVIEERGEKIIASVMKAGGLPEFNTFTGNFTDAIIDIAAWVQELEEKWSKEDK